MDIVLHEITIRELVEGYEDAGIKGVRAYSGQLDVRPEYQREFVYKDHQRTAVIDTVLKGFPLNVMYWIERDKGGFEVMDGQQRTISICQFYNGDFSKDMRFYGNLEKDEKQKFLDYKLMVYFCRGDNSEKIEWFRTINIAGEELSEQELRNAVYHGPWVTDAKRWFSRPGCPAEKIGGAYLNGSRERQDYLETAIAWLCGGTGNEINQFMAIHQNDQDASDLWGFFQDVIQWLESTFVCTSDRKKILKGVAWGKLYKKYGKEHYDTAAIEEEVKRLLMDDDVTKKNGIPAYVLTRDEKHLSLRAFSETQKMKAFERQKGVCPLCKLRFSFEEMQGDHITPWSKGGRTVDENCQMLCRDCNLKKGGK